MIAFTGATGKVGRLVADELARRFDVVTDDDRVLTGDPLPLAEIVRRLSRS
jgi:uncharacterized protein YbjT (DUF2867 family)